MNEMNKTINTKAKIYEAINYYFTIFILIVLAVIVLTLVSVVAKGQTVSVKRQNAMAHVNETAEAFHRVTNEKFILSV